MILFNAHVHQIGTIPFSGLSRFSGHFGGDGPSPLNRDTTVLGSPGGPLRAGPMDGADRVGHQESGNTLGLVRARSALIWRVIFICITPCELELK